MKYEIIGRRQALKYFSILAASAAGQEFLASWLPSMQATEMPGRPREGHTQGAVGAPAGDAAQQKPYAPKFFSADQYRTVEILTELIIPTDGQPGAREAQVARYIDFLVLSASEYLPELQKQWTSGLVILDRLSRQQSNRPFCNLSVHDQEQLLTQMSLPERDSKAQHPGFPFYSLVKETTIEAFYTSRVGLIDVLDFKGRQYLADFPGCTHAEHQS